MNLKIVQCENCRKFFNIENSTISEIEVQRMLSKGFYRERWCKYCLGEIDKPREFNLKDIISKLAASTGLILGDKLNKYETEKFWEAIENNLEGVIR